METKNLLEDQLSSSQKRVETVLELESDLMKYRQQVQEMAKVGTSFRLIKSHFTCHGVLY